MTVIIPGAPRGPEQEDEFRGVGEPAVVACPDGPFLIRGDVELLDADGNPIPRHRRTLALCRCGASNIKPFCDGTHKLVRFRTEPPTESD